MNYCPQNAINRLTDKRDRTGLSVQEEVKLDRLIEMVYANSPEPSYSFDPDTISDGMTGTGYTREH
jgi:hypothetical protein